MLERAGVAKIAIGDARARQKSDLQQPIQYNRDLAEEECAVDVWRQQHVVEREQRYRQYRRGAHDVEKIGQRGEAPLRLVEARDAVDETGIHDEGRQQNRQESPALDKPALLEANEETRDHRRRRGQEVVRQNEPHPWRETRKADHRPDLAAQMERRAPINTGLWARALPRAVMARQHATNQSPHSGTIMVNADDRLRRIACDRHTSK